MASLINKEMTKLGLGISSITGSNENNTSSDTMKALSIVLFILSQALSKFNDYHSYKKVDQYKTAQRAVVQAREIIKQRRLLDTTHQVTEQTKALLAPARSFEEQTTLDEKCARWQEMQKQLKQIFDNPTEGLSFDDDSFIALSPLSLRRDDLQVGSYV